jgi:hypothetical protein
MHGIRRRRVLAALAGAAGASAGCLDGTQVPGDEGTPGDGTDTPGTSTDGTDTPATATDGGAAGCPDYDRVERVVCYDDVDPDAVDVVLEPSRRALGPGSSVDFTLHNRSERTLRTNFYNWNVHKRVDGDWYHVAPRMWNDPLMSVSPGESHTWTLTLDNGDVEEGATVPRASGTEDVAVAGVGGGTYAFRSRGWFEDDDHDQAVAFAATFDLDANPLALVPTDAVAGTSRDGDTLVADSTRGDPDDEDYRLGAYTLARVDAPDADVRTLVAEQVVRRERLRDALALALEHDAERVRIEEYDATYPLFGLQESTVFAFRGQHYEVSARELEDGS